MNRNLDKIFDKFYPQSQTVEQGIFLKRAAWTVEIILAIIGCLIGVLMIVKYQSNPDESTTTLRLIGATADNLMMGLIFFMVGIIELTKIPLASAVYYNKTFLRRTSFLLALIAVNISTFETVVAGFERINNQRTEAFRKLLIKKDTLESQIIEKRIKVDEKNLNKQIENLQLKNDKILEQIKNIEDGNTKRKISIEQSSNLSGTIQTLSDELTRAENEKEELRTSNIESQKLLKDTSYWKKGSIEKEIAANRDRIKILNDEIKENTTKLAEARDRAQQDNQSEINIINKQAQRSIKPLTDNFRKNQKLIDSYNDDLDNIADRNRDNLQEISVMQKEVEELVQQIDITGPQNQVIRVASWFKDFFIINLEKENNKIKKDIIKLESSKVFGNILWFWRYTVERTDKEIELIDDQIFTLNQQFLRNEESLEVQKTQGSTKSVYSDIPEIALTFAFWIWFGVLSFIVSITGTMLAFASLTLRDPRTIEIKEKFGKKRIGLYWWFVRLLSARRKYIWERTKLLFKPKIIEKKIEVEKIIEKPVIEEKIVIQKVEVPVEVEKIKEVERKVFVHVPFPTDDPEVIKKGPMIYNDKDKKEKK
tara:strand:- start:958 stop:2742 length:1785 start_codon:yes stop_codon:yes gene_type:complete